jgi:hypothetical protein
LNQKGRDYLGELGVDGRVVGMGLEYNIWIMMIIIFWEMTPCGSYKNRRFGGSYRLHLQGERVRAGTERNSKLLYRRRLEKLIKSYNIWISFSFLKVDSNSECFEHRDETLGSMEAGNVNT